MRIKIRIAQIRIHQIIENPFRDNRFGLGYIQNLCIRLT